MGVRAYQENGRAITSVQTLVKESNEEVKARFAQLKGKGIRLTNPRPFPFECSYGGGSKGPKASLR